MNAKIIKAIKEEFGGEILDANGIRFEFCGETFCFTDGTIYLQIDDRFAGVGSKVKTIVAARKFVEARI